ncbi:MAG: DUF3237 family protein [Actinomycetales bacterium]|nr:DUF3237 family protein [Actinomycetales bacterium]
MIDLPFDLVPLATVRVTRGDVHRLGQTAFHRRVIGGISRGRWEGERLSADIVQPAGDWALPSTDGTIMLLDVRQTLVTDDGATIYVTYQGRADRGRGTYTVAPTFETDDERYAWLNAIQAIGQGRTEGDDIVYAMFEVR